jgi:hypothetical protein
LSAAKSGADKRNDPRISHSLNAGYKRLQPAHGFRAIELAPTASRNKP